MPMRTLRRWFLATNVTWRTSDKSHVNVVKRSVLVWYSLRVCYSWLYNTLAHPQGQHCSNIMKPLQNLLLQMAERLRRAKPNSVANHVTDCAISDWCALTWFVTETGWARSKRSAICSGNLISVHMIWYDINRRYVI